ncbi:MAG: DUF2304 domain-containing protein [Acidimicrobiales bacterium]
MTAALAAVAVLAADAADETGPQGGLSTAAHLFLLAGAVGSTLFILFLLRNRQLRGKYALLWTAMGAVLLVLALFPGLLTALAERLGIYYPPALFLVAAIGFLLVVVVHFSWEMSRVEDRTRTLAEELALLRTELDLRVPEPESDGEQAGRTER